MSRLVVPDREDAWPSLGPQVCDFIEDMLVHGPGDVLGEPIELTGEEQEFLYDMYQVFPRGHERAGRRRFKTEVYSRRKGARKTELGAWVAITESYPEAPVRCGGWRQFEGTWVPVGRPVTDPFIPMVATVKDQVEELAYGSVYAILRHKRCPLVDEYSVTLERTSHLREGGEIRPMTSAPDARDGARTSFQHFDEPHLFKSARLRGTVTTMMGNVPKRVEADAHSLFTSTMFGPGEGSALEEIWTTAVQVFEGKLEDSSLLYDHRQAREKSYDLSVDEQLRAAIVEASGDAIGWADVESIFWLCRKWIQQGLENRARRYWLNQARRTADKWHPVVDLWEDRKVDPEHDGKLPPPPDGTEVVLFFDGSYNRDSTALIGATVDRVPYVFEVAVWERTVASPPSWRTPRGEVMDTIGESMGRWTVVELAPDPYGWHREVEELEQTYGETVVRFETNQPKRMGTACDDFEQATVDGELVHDGSEVVGRHLGNCVPVVRRGHRVVTKESDDSPYKIDAAIGAIGAHHRARWHWTHRDERDDEVAAVVVDVSRAAELLEQEDAELEEKVDG